MQTRFLYIFLFNSLFNCIIAQDIEYAKSVVKILASDGFKGRGYVGGGDKIAAEFIEAEFEKLSLHPFGKSYRQTFTTSVNTFPSTMSLNVDGKEKVAGIDFLVNAGSPGISGRFETVHIKITDIFDQEKLATILGLAVDKFIIIPIIKPTLYSKEEQAQIKDVLNFLKYHPENPSAGTILLTQTKLIWGASTKVYTKPTVTLVHKPGGAMAHVELKIKNEFHEKYKSQNVIGYISGTSSDSLIVLSAHYDHLGMMGSRTTFPGANDNASGIAMLLNMAKHYKENKPKHTTIFIAFGGEELGLVGSQYFVEHPLFKLSKIKFLLNFDISGTGDDGIQVVNGSVYRQQFDRMLEINKKGQFLKKVKIRGEACNSDHCFFHVLGVPCFFIYTLGGIQAYHDIYDKSQTLPLTEFEDYFKLVRGFLNGF